MKRLALDKYCTPIILTLLFKHYFFEIVFLWAWFLSSDYISKMKISFWRLLHTSTGTADFSFFWVSTNHLARKSQSGEGLCADIGPFTLGLFFKSYFRSYSSNLGIKVAVLKCVIKWMVVKICVMKQLCEHQWTPQRWTQSKSGLYSFNQLHGDCPGAEQGQRNRWLFPT